jgi:hypothetical protein
MIFDAQEKGLRTPGKVIHHIFSLHVYINTHILKVFFAQRRLYHNF